MMIPLVQCLIVAALTAAALLEIRHRYRIDQRMQRRVDALMRP